MILGLASTGFNSNGYSLVRRVVADNGFAYDAPFPMDESRTVGQALIAPTRIYVRSVLAAIRETGAVKALAHITGGGFVENIPRVLPEGIVAEIEGNSWTMPDVFRWVMHLGGIEESEMGRTFNCGIGMIVVVAADKAAEVSKVLAAAGETVWTIGHLRAQSGDEPRVEIKGVIGSLK